MLLYNIYLQKYGNGDCLEQLATQSSVQKFDTLVLVVGMLAKGLEWSDERVSRKTPEIRGVALYRGVTRVLQEVNTVL